MNAEVFIPLTRGLVTVIDFDDFERVGRVKWYALPVARRVYAVRSLPRNKRKQKKIFLHREVLNTPAGMQTDHISGSTLDNRKSNLRAATRSQNSRAFRRKAPNSSSTYRGVSKESGKQWRADIYVNRRHRTLGFFENEQDAARAYDAAALEQFGEFACLNFPIDSKHQKSN